MSSNGEIIHVHVGQAGIQIANACWELYCLEHGVNPNGCMYENPMDDSFKVFFANSNTQKMVPRMVMVDSEPTVIDEVRTGTYGNLFKPETLITGKEDSGSNFGRGYNVLATELVDITMNSIRCVAEGCCNLRGFIVFRSLGGGTGSGLGNRIFEELADEYGKLTKLDFAIFPSASLSPLIVEPYNSVLASHVGMDVSECTFILDNEALYDICETKLDVPFPTYTNLNRIIAQVVSALTASQRFYGSLNVSFSDFTTNLVPFPRIHFPVVSYAPLVTTSSAYYTELNTEQMTLESFQPSNQLVHCNPAEGDYMSCMLLYRGNVTPVDINTSITLLKSKNMLSFVDWSPTGFKIGMNSMPPFPVPGGDVGTGDRAMIAVMNNTVITKIWCRLIDKFNCLYGRRAFVHHFISEGIEESVFEEASEDICTLIGDYREVSSYNIGGPHVKKKYKSSKTLLLTSKSMSQDQIQNKENSSSQVWGVRARVFSANNEKSPMRENDKKRPSKTSLREKGSVSDAKELKFKRPSMGSEKSVGERRGSDKRTDKTDRPSRTSRTDQIDDSDKKSNKVRKKRGKKVPKEDVNSDDTENGVTYRLEATVTPSECCPCSNQERPSPSQPNRDVRSDRPHTSDVGGKNDQKTTHLECQCRHSS